MSVERLIPRRCVHCRAEQVYRDSRWTTTRASRSNGRCQHKWRPIGTSSTTRNRKCECRACDYETLLYCSRAQIQRALPFCACGERVIPASLEDTWLAVEAGQLDADVLDSHPEALLLGRYEDRAASAQQGHAARGRVRNAPALIAEGYVMAERYDANVKRRLAAILPTPEPMPF
jgi:hypothetical protein